MEQTDTFFLNLVIINTLCVCSDLCVHLCMCVCVCVNYISRENPPSVNSQKDAWCVCGFTFAEIEMFQEDSSNPVGLILADDSNQSDRAKVSLL